MSNSPLINEHLRRNQLTAGFENQFSGHREQVTHLIRSTGKNGSVCLLGAGNCNDVDLELISSQFQEVHLADLDAAAVARSRGSLSDALAAKVAIHAPMDLSGAYDEMASWSLAHPPDQERVEALIARVNSHVPSLPGPYDVVASLCLLSQLIESVAICLATEHAKFIALLMAIRNRHLRLLTELTRHGGVAILVSDFVSSDTLPVLHHLTDGELAEQMPLILSDRNFFTGSNPVALIQKLEELRAERGPEGRVTVTGPWRWTMGRKVFAVCGFTTEL